MLTVITERKEIDKYQRIFKNIMTKALPEKIKNTIGFQGGSREETVNYDSDVGFWCFFSTDVDGVNRYWNTFGLQNPNDVNTLNIVVEINFPFEFNRRVGGVFLKDDFGAVYLGHRGRIGGGRKDISKTRFFEHYKDTVEEVKDNDRENKVAVISPLDSPYLVHSIKAFVETVGRIKEQANNPTKNLILTASQKTALTFTPENELGSTSSVDKTFEKKQLHAIVVNNLSETISKMGYKTANTQAIDLLVESGQGKSHLFEVKSQCDLQSIYTAIGQLMYHGLAFAATTKKILVVPDDLPKNHRSIIERLNVAVLTFSDVNGKIRFLNLSELGFKGVK